MKKILIILLLIPAMTYGQNVYEVTGSQYDLKSKYLSWIGKTYKNPGKVISFETDAQVVINGKGIVKAAFGTDFYYKMEVDFKDDRYRVTFDNIVIDTGMLGKMNYQKSGNKKLKLQIEQYLQNLERDILEHMKVDDSW